MLQCTTLPLSNFLVVCISRLNLTMNDTKELFLGTHFVMDCPVHAFARAADWNVNDGPVDQMVHSLQTADERHWNTAWHLGNFHHSRGYSHCCMQCQTHVWEEAQNNWANQNTHAVTDKYTHACALAYTFFHFLLYFCCSGAFSTWRRGVISLSNVLRSWVIVPGFDPLFCWRSSSDWSRLISFCKITCSQRPKKLLNW